MVSTNRHPVDELADVRAEIKRLQEHEAELKSQIIGTRQMLGNEFEAKLTEVVTERVDVPALRKYMGNGIREFLKPSSAITLRIVKREMAEEVG